MALGAGRTRTLAASLAMAAGLVAGLAGQVLASSTPAGATFLNSSSSTDSPALKVDGAGGMHLAFAGYYTSINPGDDPNQPGSYAYCDPNADCSVAANWAQVQLGAHVQGAQLQLTPAGQPRILLETADTANGDTSSYWYAACDGGCTDPANWSMLDLVDTSSIVGDVRNQPKHSFALDPQGNPRLLYGSGNLVYATCDAACTDTIIDPNSGQAVPANWLYAVVNTGLYFNQPTLAFTSAGLPRASAFVYNPSDFSFTDEYLECNAGCTDGSQWTMTAIMAQGQGPLAMSLRLDALDHVGLAVSQSNQLW